MTTAQTRRFRNGLPEFEQSLPISRLVRRPTRRSGTRDNRHETRAVVEKRQHERALIKDSKENGSDPTYTEIVDEQRRFVSMFKNNDIPESCLQGLYTYVMLKQQLLSPSPSMSKAFQEEARKALGEFRLSSEIPLNDLPRIEDSIKGISQNPLLTMKRIARQLNFGAMKLKPNAKNAKYLEFIKSGSENPIQIAISDLEEKLGIDGKNGVIFSLTDSIALLLQGKYISGAFVNKSQQTGIPVEGVPNQGILEPTHVAESKNREQDSVHDIDGFRVGGPNGSESIDLLSLADSPNSDAAGDISQNDLETSLQNDFELIPQDELENMIDKKHSRIIANGAIQALQEPEIYRELFDEPRQGAGGEQVFRLAEMILVNTTQENRESVLKKVAHTIEQGLDHLNALTTENVVGSLKRLYHYIEGQIDNRRSVKNPEQYDLREVLSEILRTVKRLESIEDRPLDRSDLRMYIYLLKHASKHCHSLAKVTDVISPEVESSINLLPSHSGFGDSGPVDDVCTAISDEFAKRKTVVKKRIKAEVDAISLPQVEKPPKAEELLAEEFSLIRSEFDTCEKLFQDEELQPVKVELQQLRKELNRLDRPLPPDPTAFPDLLKELAGVIKQIERVLEEAYIPKESYENLYEAVLGVRHFFHTRTKLLNKCFDSNNPEDGFVNWKNREGDLLMKSAEVSELVRVSRDPEKIKAEKIRAEELKREADAIFRLMLDRETNDATLKEAILRHFELCSKELNVVNSSEVLKRLDKNGIRTLQDLEDAVSFAQYHYGWGHRASVYHSRLLRSIAELRNFQRTRGTDKAAKMFGMLGIAIVLWGVHESSDIGFQSHDPKLAEHVSYKFASFEFANFNQQFNQQLSNVADFCNQILGDVRLDNLQKEYFLNQVTSSLDHSSFVSNPQAFIDTLAQNVEQVEKEYKKASSSPIKLASLGELVNPNKPQVVLSTEDPLGAFIQQHGEDATPSVEILRKQVDIVYSRVDNLENLRLVQDNKYDEYSKNYPVADNSSEVYQFVREIYEQINLLKLKGCDQTHIISLKERLSDFESQYVSQQALLTTLRKFNELMNQRRTPEKAGMKGLAEAFIGSQRALRKNFIVNSEPYKQYEMLYSMNLACFLEQLQQSVTNQELTQEIIGHIESELDTMIKNGTVIKFSNADNYAATIVFSETKNLREAVPMLDWFKVLYEDFDYNLQKVINHCRGGAGIPAGAQHETVNGEHRRVVSDNERVNVSKLTVTEEVKQQLLDGLRNPNGFVLSNTLSVEEQKTLFALFAHMMLSQKASSPTGTWIHPPAQRLGAEGQIEGVFRPPMEVIIRWMALGIRGGGGGTTLQQFPLGLENPDQVAMFTSLKQLQNLMHDSGVSDSSIWVNYFAQQMQEQWDQDHPKGPLRKLVSGVGNAGSKVFKAVKSVFR